MTPEEARRRTLDLLGLPEEKRGAYVALCDQLNAWKRDHPGVDAMNDPVGSEILGRIGALVLR